MSFDAELFMTTQYTDAMDTEFPLIPVNEYDAKISSASASQFTTDDGREFTTMLIQWEILDDLVREETGLPHPTCRQRLFLDMDENTGGLLRGRGKNVKLGQVREAVGQNIAGQPWNPTMLIEAAARVRVGHVPRRNDPDVIDAEVKAVTKLTGGAF